jgi:protein-S-isoprenylcysteine O-methyltransferase Ste14
MYLGMMIMALGGLLLYRTWTFLLLLSNLPALLIRAWREEEVLAQAFAVEWTDYQRRVPGWIPRYFRKRTGHT